MVSLSVVVCSVAVLSLVRLMRNPEYTAETIITSLPSKVELDFTRRRPEFVGEEPAMVLTHTHTEYLLSRSISNAVVNQFLSKVEDPPEKQKIFLIDDIKNLALKTISRMPSYLSYGKYKDLDDEEILTRKLMKRIKVRNVAGSFIMKISVTWDNPYVAAEAVNLIAAEYARVNRKANQQSFTYKKSVIQKRLDEFTRQLTSIDEEIKNFKKDSDIWNMTKDLELKFKELTDYLEQKTALELKVLDTKARLRNLKSVQAVSDTLRLHADMIAATSSLESINKAIERQKKLLKGVPDLEYGLTELLKRREDCYNTIVELRQDMTQALIDEAGIVSEIAVIDKARVPMYPSSPNFIFNVIAALVVGTVICLMLLFVLELMTQKVYGWNDVSGEPFEQLGVIPATHSHGLFYSATPTPRHVIDMHVHEIGTNLFSLDGARMVLFDTVRTTEGHIKSMQRLLEVAPQPALLITLGRMPDTSFTHVSKEPIESSAESGDRDAPRQLLLSGDGSVVHAEWPKQIDGVLLDQEFRALVEFCNKMKSEYSTVAIAPEPIACSSYSERFSCLCDCVAVFVSPGEVSKPEMLRYAERRMKTPESIRVIYDSVAYPGDLRFH